MSLAGKVSVQDSVGRSLATVHDAAGARTARRGSTHPPVILLGGEANALSIARSLGAMGVDLYFIGQKELCARHSRHLHWIRTPETTSSEKSWADVEQGWAEYLLGPAARQWVDRGTIILACCDAGLRVLARHREALLGKGYRLDLSDPDAQLAMLDKAATYRHAREAGVPTPRFWTVESREQVCSLRGELVYPLLVKPRLSHLFEEKFGQKHLSVSNFQEATAAFDATCAAGVQVLLTEFIPGGDDLLCSYYTYLDESGEPQFHFTKRIIRRFPPGMGAACYHVTDWIPELPPLANRLFAQAGLRGLANAEFKLDPRDGQYKLIECNARFTAGNSLVAASGFDLGAFVYNRLADRPQAPLIHYRSGLRLWDPYWDYCSFKELRARGELSTFRWVRSILHRQTFAYFAVGDPLPELARLSKPVRRALSKRAVGRATGGEQVVTGAGRPWPSHRHGAPVQPPRGSGGA